MEVDEECCPPVDNQLEQQLQHQTDQQLTGKNTTATRVVLHALIDYVPMDKPPQFNQSQVTTNRFNSVFVMNRVDELDVMEVCQMLAYYLRVRFDVSFDRAPETAEEQAGYNLFYSLSDFASYYKSFKSFITRMYHQNQLIADQFEQFVAENMASSGEAAADGGGGGRIPQETIEILKQFRELRNVFGQFFDSFASEKFDPAILYERLFLERTASSTVALVIPIEAVGSLERMFDQLSYLCVQSIDHCNSVMPAMISAGFVIYSLLYLCGGGGGDLIDSPEPLAWGKINTNAEGMPAWLHAQIETESYKREIGSLPADLFDPNGGDVYVNKHDFLATLLAQTLNRLFTRMIEWPMRDDVSSWMNDFLKCDNINRFFNEHGRNQQLWICFRKRKNEAKDLPSVYVNLNKLNTMYDRIALAAKKQPQQPQQQQAADEASAGGGGGGGGSLIGGVLTGSGPGASNAAAANIALPPEDASVRERLDQLQTFKRRYSVFWANGIRQPSQRKFQETYATLCRQFVLVSGGYRGSSIQSHAASAGHSFDPEQDLLVEQNLRGVVFRGCASCTAALLPESMPDMLQLDRWCEHVNNLIFPYNFVALSTAFSGYTPDTLRSAIVYKMLEGFAVRRMTTDRAEKMLNFFEENRAICSFVVTQSDMIALWTRATQQLAFFKDFLGNC